MKTPISLTAAVALLALVIAASANATLVPIYRNALDTTAQRSEVLKLSGRDCTRAGAGETLQIAVGKRTEVCAFQTPVHGRNLEIAATARLSPATPRAVARRAFVGLVLRAGGGSRYELRVFPRQRKTQLVKVTESGAEYLAIRKGVDAVQGVSRANVLRLRAEGAKATVGLSAYIGPTLVGKATDRGATIPGEHSALSLGAPGNGHRAVASFDAIVVRVPVRF